jgi:hypothetical protein
LLTITASAAASIAASTDPVTRIRDPFANSISIVPAAGAPLEAGFLGAAFSDGVPPTAAEDSATGTN